MMETNTWVENLTDEQLIELVEQWDNGGDGIDTTALIRKVAGEIKNKNPEAVNSIDMMLVVIMSASVLAKRFKLLIGHHGSLSKVDK